MSTSLYCCRLDDTNRHLLEMWATCCNTAIFGGRGGIYPGHGDQGVLNALLYKHLGPAGVELLDDHLWSQHRYYWQDTIIVEQGILINEQLGRRQRALHSVGAEKFWSPAHRVRLNSNPNHIIHYLWFLAFLWGGPCQHWQAPPFSYLAAELTHLVDDLTQFEADLIRISPWFAPQLPALRATLGLTGTSS